MNPLLPLLLADHPDTHEFRARYSDPAKVLIAFHSSIATATDGTRVAEWLAELRGLAAICAVFAEVHTGDLADMFRAGTAAESRAKACDAYGDALMLLDGYSTGDDVKADDSEGAPSVKTWITEWNLKYRTEWA